MNAFRSSGLYQMRLRGEESRRSRARLLAARSLDAACGLAREDWPW